MAPSSSQAVTIVGISAIVTGVILLIYIIRQQRKTKETQEDGKEEDDPPKAEESHEADSRLETPSEQPETELPAAASGDSFTVSQSWAILNGNSDNSAFPENLSPCQSAIMVDSTLGSESMIQSTTEDILEYESVPSHVGLSDEEEEVSETECNQQSIEILSTAEASGASALVREQEVVEGEDLHLQYDMLLKAHTESAAGEQWTKQDISEALMAAQSPQTGLIPKHAQVLVFLLSHSDPHLKHVAVQSISRCATFTDNQNLLREHGCLQKLSKLLELQQMAMWLRHSGATTSIEPTINAVTNLAVNSQNNDEMEPCVPTLIDISLDKDTGETVCLSSLQALTNLSVTSKHHGHYTRLVQRLYEFLSVDNASIQLQALKILVNLSCNPDNVPNLLAAKAPECLLEILHPSHTQEAVILRFVTLLANVLHVVKEKQITSSSLPPDDKAPSPETMYSALLGLSSVGNLKNKVFLLCKHSNEEIRLQAAKVYNQLK